MPLFFDQDETEFDGVCDRANPPAHSMIKPLLTLTMLSGAGFMAGGALVAGFVGAPIVVNLAGRIKRFTSNQVFLHHNPNCLAHLISSDKDMATYLKELGRDEVEFQLRLALEKHQKFTRAARKTGKKLLGDFQKPTLEALLDELAPAIPEVKSEGVNAVEGTVNIDDYDPQWFDPNTGGSLPLACILKSPYSSYLLIGGQRTGKSYFAAVASRELVKTGTKIYHLNLASYGDEDGYYWTHATKSVVGDLSTITDPDEAQNLIDSALEVIAEFWEDTDAILICDEITLAGSKHNHHSELMGQYLKTIAGKISSLTTTGMKRRKAIWCACPELVAGALQDSAKAIKSLKLLYFAISPGQFAEWQGQSISFDHSLHQQIKANWTAVEMPNNDQVDLLKTYKIDRIVWISDQWLPVGELPKIENTGEAKSQETEKESISTGSTLTKVKTKTVVIPEAHISNETRTEDLIDETYRDCFAQIQALQGEEAAITKLITKEATRRKIGASVIARLAANENIEYRDQQMGNATRHFFKFIVDSEEEEIDIN
jgi:hypothetical protein